MIAEYLHTRDLVLQELKILEKTFQPSLEQALWEMNKAQLHSTLKGIMELPIIVGVQIKNPKGKLLGEMGDVSESVVSSGMGESSSGLFWNTFHIRHTREDRSFLVGSVTIYSSRIVVFDKVKFSFLFLIINAVIKIIGFWILFLWISRVLLSRPLAELTQAAKQLNLDNLENVKVQVRTKGRDEFRILQEAFTSMIQKLFQTRSELYKSKEQLEVRVDERTAELKESREQYKKLYEESKETEGLYHSLLESTPDAIITYDPDGKTQYVNPAFVRTFGWTLAEIADGVPYTPESEKEISMSKIVQVIRDGIPVSDFETIRYSKDGGILNVSISASRFHDHEGRSAGMLVILRNITERKLWEETLKIAKEKAESANQAKSTFLANMSHELRTPLNAILGFSQLMSHSPNLNPKQRENLQIINRSGGHLLTLINDILDMSKIEAGQSTLNENDMDLLALLEDVKNLFKERMQNRGLSLQVERSASVPRFIRADEAKLRQILINLISNAVKCTEQGEVKLRIGGGSWQPMLPEGKIALQFEVEDTGPGIDPDEFEHLFDPFVQTRASQKYHEGTGLGLPISREFAQLMGGDMQVQSQVGVGSVFQFTIQVYQGYRDDLEIEKPARIIALKPNQPCRILIVDDIYSNRQVLRQLLSPIGFDLREAQNGEEAIAIYKEWRPHLLWMDIRMPVMDGYQATQQLKKLIPGKETIIIAISASAFEDKKEEALSAGCDDFIAKPFKEAEIFNMMQKHLGLEYVYEEESSKESLTKDQNLGPTIEMLKALPTEWKKEMKQAIEHVDLHQMHLQITKVREQDGTLADLIQRQMDNFEYERILAQIE